MVEIEHMHARALVRVFDHGAGFHDEGPVARLRQHQLAGGLVQGSAAQVVAGVGVLPG